MLAIIKGTVRYEVVNHAFEDWKRIMSNGLTAKQARKDIERDYELLEREQSDLHEMMLEWHEDK